MILIATIEHSGTHRLLDLLGWNEGSGRGREVVPLEETARAHPDSILFAHLYDERMPAILDCAQRMPVITTQRPADDIRASWIRRNRNLDELDRQLDNFRRLQLCSPYVLHLGKPI